MFIQRGEHLKKIQEIVVLFTKEFTKWVLIANIVAWPVGYFIMNKVLQVYAYKIKIGIDIFIFSGMVALAVSLATVIYQALKAARNNPVDGLRYE